MNWCLVASVIGFIQDANPISLSVLIEISKFNGKELSVPKGWLIRIPSSFVREDSAWVAVCDNGLRESFLKKQVSSVLHWVPASFS